MVSESHQFRGVISFVVKGIGVDIHDVAKAHIIALGTLPMVIGNQYSFSSESRIPSQDAAEALKKVVQEAGLGDLCWVPQCP